MNKFDEISKGTAASFTRRRALKSFGVGLAGMALMRFGQQRARAITNGALDNDAHPNVCGAVWLHSPVPPYPAPFVGGCGTLIHPRVVLTVGHGTELIAELVAEGAMTLGDLLLSFSPNALDSTSWRGLSNAITHPGYAAAAQAAPGSGAPPLPDVGVLVLREPAVGLIPASLPPLGFLDALQATGTLRPGSDRAPFTVVGYGALLGDPVGQIPLPADGLRRVAQSRFLNLHDRWLFLDQKSTLGNGGGSFGDSGGPIFWVDPATGANTLVAITSRGDPRAVATGVGYRIDIAEARSFLDLMIARVEAGEL